MLLLYCHSEQLLQPTNSSELTTKGGSSVSPTIKLSLRLFMGFLKEQQDMRSCSVMVETVKSVLDELSILSLENEPSDCLQPLQELLFSLIEGKTRISPNEKDYLELKKSSMEAAILMALGTGSAADLLHIVQYLFAHSQQKSTNPLKLNVSALLRRFKEWEIPLILSPIYKECNLPFHLIPFQAS